MTRLAILFLVLVAAAPAASIDVAREAAAVRLVEGWRGRDGAAGERGPYQITAAVWALQMPGKPFAEARHEAPAHACALKHLAWLARQLAAAGIDPNPYNVALAYNAGLGAVLRGRAPLSAYDYATRVANLYQISGARVSPVSGSATVRTCDERAPSLGRAAPFRVCLPSTDQHADRLGLSLP